jgi:hypothetical protein
VGLLQDIENKFLSAVFERISRALGPFGKLIDFVKRFFTSFRDSFRKGVELSQKIVAEIHEWRTFKEAVPVRTGVINLPAAIDNSQRLLDQIKAAWQSIVSLAQEIKKQASSTTEEGNPAEEAEQAIKDVESGGFKGLLERFPKLAKGFERVLGFLAIAVSVVETIGTTIDDLTNIVDAIAAIREEIETGSTIFLQQKNARRVVTLEDGTKMKIRVGNLHQ